MSSNNHSLLNIWRNVGATIVVLALGTPGAAGADPLSPGTAFPALADAGLEGQLPDLAAARVVIVDFWASWCGPCKASFPVYDDLQKEFSDDGLVVIAVSVDQDARAMEKFLGRMKPVFAVVRDARQQLVQAAGVPTMPTSFILDDRGVVRFVHAGFHGDSTRRAYIKEIKTLLEEQP